MSKFHFDPHSLVICVDVVLFGPERSHTVKMILDTGASFTLINPAALEFVGYDLIRNVERRKITTASGIEVVPFLRLHQITALGQSAQNLLTCAHTLPSELPAEGL